jgi:3'(2'), 5'-bisphosphate nucleotidase
MGSAIKFALIAEGLYDVYPRFGPTSEWDTAAGQILLEVESGGLYSLLTGEPMLYGKKSWSNGGFLAARTNELLETWTPRMRLHQT